MNQNYIYIENSFGVGIDNSINTLTREIVARSDNFIIEELLSNLFPELIFEIVYLPPEIGSFKEVRKIIIKGVKKEILKSPITISSSVLGLSILIYTSFIQSPSLTPEQRFNECAKLLKESSDGDYVPSNNKLIESCNNTAILRSKNEKITKLEEDKNIRYELTTIKDSSNKVVYSKKIDRTNFAEMHEIIEDNLEYNKESLDGNIELAQPYILKQTQYGSGKPWNGIYYGNHVYDLNDKIVLENGQSVDFYMQDSEYKNQINDKKVSFESGDSIGIIFDINVKYDVYKKEYRKPRIYVKRVQSHGDNLVSHKLSYQAKKKEEEIKLSDYQTPLF